MPKDKTDPGADAEEAPAAETATISYDDADWEIPASIDDCPWDAIRAYEDGKALRFLELALGPAQVARFKRSKRRTGRDADALMRKVMDSFGAAPGE